MLSILIGICWLPGAAQAWPGTPPDNGILDDTRALGDATGRLLAERISTFREVTGCDFWIVAATQLDSDQPPRTQSRELRRQWSGDRQAIVLLFSRGADAASISVSPHLWDRYPAADLITALQSAGTQLSQKERPLDERLAESMTGLMDQITRMEKVRTQHSAGLAPVEWQAAVSFGGSLVLLCLTAAVFGWRSRRAQNAAAEHHFPTAHVPSRLGAQFGGGVIVETHPPAS